MGWKEYSDNNTRNLIAESLRHLMMSKPFESIRIKDICNEVGVVRVTFYNYFIDKYDTLDYLIKNDLIVPNEELADQGKLLDIAKAMIKTIDSKWDFYRIAYKIEGQNSFESLMRNNLSELFLRMLKNNRREDDSPNQISNRMVAVFFAQSMTYAIYSWLFYPQKVSSEKCFDYVSEVMHRSMLDFLK